MARRCGILRSGILRTRSCHYSTLALPGSRPLSPFLARRIPGRGRAWARQCTSSPVLSAANQSSASTRSIPVSARCVAAAGTMPRARQQAIIRATHSRHRSGTTVVAKHAKMPSGDGTTVVAERASASAARKSAPQWDQRLDRHKGGLTTLPIEKLLWLRLGEAGRNIERNGTDKQGSTITATEMRSGSGVGVGARSTEPDDDPPPVRGGQSSESCLMTRRQFRPSMPLLNRPSVYVAICADTLSRTGRERLITSCRLNWMGRTPHSIWRLPVSRAIAEKKRRIPSTWAYCSRPHLPRAAPPQGVGRMGGVHPTNAGDPA